MVGLNASKVFCIVCRTPDLYPPVMCLTFIFCLLRCNMSNCFKNCCFHFQVMPKPVLTLLSLSIPLASSDLGADDLEKEFILSNLNLTQVSGISV